jgi:hypothetical protein
MQPTLDGQPQLADCDLHLTRTMMREDDQACAECGAIGCEALLHACLAADFSDPEYGRVHHLVVPTYGLQHGWYTAEAEAGMVQFLLSHLDRAPRDHDRRSIRATADGPVQVRARQPRTRHLDWEHHIGDVDRSSAATYVATVRHWASSVATMLFACEHAAERRDA